MFKNSAVLQKLVLSGNIITNVANGSFSGAGGLQHLDLSDNMLVTVPAKAMRGI